uniref:Peroxidase n=1 Tax=Romanomermis culicivorax TaxID=13658 RepID=A0A915I1S1_ROMCU
MLADTFENCALECNSTIIDRMDLKSWIDTEPRHKLPITEDTLKKAMELGATRLRELKDKEKSRVRLNDDSVRPGSSVFSHNVLMSPRPESLDLARTAEFLLETTKVLIKGDQLNENERIPKELDTRTLQTLLPQVDLTRNGQPLPSAREVANVIHESPEIEHIKYAHMLMQFAQFVDHDLTHSPVARSPEGQLLNCTRCDSAETVSPSCFPIPIPRNDPFFPANNDDGTPRCMAFVRSLIGQLTLGYREQINQLTSFLDTSTVYGSYDCQATELRLFSQGKLNYTERLDTLQHGLPQGAKEPDCRSLPKYACFVAGDNRVNEQTGLAVIHTLYLREHNRIAEKLHKINNFWTDEKIYQETRRIINAMNNHIIYNEFLPKVLGCEIMDKYGLRLKKTGYYTGHYLFDNDQAGGGGGVEPLLVGLLGAPAMNYDRFLNTDIRHHLFEFKDIPFSGMDLAALNIQRSRDHGIPGYNFYREFCGFAKATSFEQLSDFMATDAVHALQSVYNHVDDIDLFPGVMSEKSVPGGLLGPTGACIIAEQFQRARRCDRYWFENDFPEMKFTPNQLSGIRKITLAKILCTNSASLKNIQPRVFEMPDDFLNAQVSCQDLLEVDLYEWLDRQFCVVDHRVINLGKTKRITPCVSCTCTSEGPECHSVRIDNCNQLLDEFLFTEVSEDTVCVIQCSSLLKKRNGRL